MNATNLIQSIKLEFKLYEESEIEKLKRKKEQRVETYREREVERAQIAKYQVDKDEFLDKYQAEKLKEKEKLYGASQLNIMKQIFTLAYLYLLPALIILVIVLTYLGII